MIDVECVVNGHDLLGEVPIWCPRTKKLWWINVRRPCMLESFDPATREHKTYPTQGTDLGSWGLREKGGFVIALNDGFYAFDPETLTHEKLVELEPDKPKNRLNDAKCDRRGRYWVGTQALPSEGPKAFTGTFYRIDPDLSFTKFFDGIGIANGVAISPDDKTFYFADTRANTIWAFDFDLDAGRLSNRRVFCDGSRNPGLPDGATIDAEGFLWVAEVMGNRLVRYAPNGSLDRIIPLPVNQPTSCAFGGDKLDVLYVTTATQGMKPERLAGEPWSGGLLAMDVGVRGVPEPCFKG